MPQLVIGSAGAVNFTLRIGWPQLEQSSFASPPQRTVAGTVGVNTPAEVVTLTTPPAFGSAYSLYAAGVPYAPATYANAQGLGTIYASATDLLTFWRNPTDAQVYANVRSGSVSNFYHVATAWATGALGKEATAVAASDQALSFNGSAVVTAAAALPVGVNAVIIGANQAGGQNWDGDITEFAIWPATRLPNASLISGTL
jgi:hypothetical protein